MAMRRHNDGDAVLESQRAVLRDVQLRFRLPVRAGADDVRPSKGSCAFAMAFQIERGDYGPVSLDGLGFIVLGLTPEAMGKGNWSVGLLADERASAEQRDAITAIASGAAGGPMAALRRSSASSSASNRRRSASIAAARSGRSPRRAFSTWRLKAPWESIRPRPSRCTSRTPATRPPIALPSRMRRAATCTRSGSSGTM